jgi:adenylate cyclase
MSRDLVADDMWRKLLTKGELKLNFMRRMFAVMPAEPRCKMCHVPFRGVGGSAAHLVLGMRPAKQNPHFCNMCERFAEKYPGGAEVELTMLFADIRGSTTLAENMAPVEYSQLISRFYKAASKVLIKTDAMIDNFIGDSVIGIYYPGIAGPRYAHLAITAAIELLRVTGHGDGGAPWLPIGVGVHTGIAYAGTVPGGGVADTVVLGDNMNITARLSSTAKTGEALISEATCAAAGLDGTQWEQRQLELKGKSEGVGVRVLTADHTL